VTVHACNRTPAALAGKRQPAPGYSQAENRQRGSVGKLTRNGGDFSAVREIADVAAPSAARIAALTAPLRLRPLVLNTPPTQPMGSSAQ
jgi:hypothetical protein